ncbi:MAG: PIN domain-containing protein [Candidatus Zixiibacteriota bacterium]
MPAVVQPFDGVTSFPQRAYLDTSYLLHLRSFPAEPDRAIYKSSKTFFDNMVRNDVDMCTSILAIQECFYIIIYKTGISEDMRHFKTADGKPFQNIPDFKKQIPKEFKKSFRKHFPKTFLFLQFLHNLGVKILYPKEYITPGMSSKSKRITHYAYGLLNRYELEPMDAFHISVAKCMGMDYIVSNDRGFKQVDNITLFIYK